MPAWKIRTAGKLDFRKTTLNGSLRVRRKECSRVLLTAHTAKDRSWKGIQQRTEPSGGDRVADCMLTKSAISNDIAAGLKLVQRAPDVSMDGLGAATGTPFA